MTNAQTAVACVLLAVAPAVYEWHAAARTRADQNTLRSQLAVVQNRLAAEQSALDRTEFRLRSANTALAQLRGDLEQGRAPDAVARAARANLYLWSDASDFVRIPKSMINDLTLVSKEKKIPLDTAGTEPLRDALGMTPVETASVLAAFQTLERDYQQLAPAHTYLTNQPPKEFQVGNRKSQTIVTAAFSDAGATLENNLQSSLFSILGQERADVVWQQAEPLFADQFNDFGKLEKFETLAVGSDGTMNYWKTTRTVGETNFSGWNSSGFSRWEQVPANFRTFAAGQLNHAGAKAQN